MQNEKKIVMQQSTNFISKANTALMYYHINIVYMSWLKPNFKILLKIGNFNFLLISNIQIYVLVDKNCPISLSLNRIVPRKGHVAKLLYPKEKRTSTNAYFSGQQNDNKDGKSHFNAEGCPMPFQVTTQILHELN